MEQLEERHDFNQQFRYPKPKKPEFTASPKPSDENQRRIQIRREIEWRLECKAAGIDFNQR
ncbi:hypothetical protein TUM4438_10470 [Shewanella sairae]|uniref:Uncharacterized protein n=1 Tax=Shewanella sairae TaxID=190310 RepID=A0ABQ4P6X0_9GAMM|nr:hypothetical protein [Shewanella sairae]MCL1130481.1 hypothetical protein [Shewanella sairae]GIU42881.1 hypothetical protein TUM4438_10470 [Shewanella sairae]